MPSPTNGLANQAETILLMLEEWCRARPGRRVIMGMTAGGEFKAALETRLPSCGKTLTDALAQTATVAGLEP